MPDFGEMAEELKYQRRNVDGFVAAVIGSGQGKQMQFRVDPTTGKYGSSFPWHDMQYPEFHPNYQYRLAAEND